MAIKESEQIWTERIEEFKKSGQTKKLWCMNNNVSIKTFYGWFKKLSAKKTPRANTQNQFVLAQPVAEVMGGKNEAGVSIKINHTEILVHRGFCEETLSGVIRVVSRIC